MGFSGFTQRSGFGRGRVRRCVYLHKYLNYSNLAADYAQFRSYVCGHLTQF